MMSNDKLLEGLKEDEEVSDWGDGEDGSKVGRRKDKRGASV